MQRKHVESYAHYYAKSIVADWFRQKWLENRERGFDNNYFIFDWEPDLSDGDHGIRLEYPILSRKLASGEQELLGLVDWGQQMPDLDKLAENKTVECVFDLAIISQGRLKYAIEIVHKHPCSNRKIRLLKTLNQNHEILVYEISASWILDQIKRPAKLKMTKINS